MNPQNQKPQNTNPDLDFIRNTTDPLETPVKKGLDKKIIVIIVLVVITLGVLVFGMVTGANKKVQKSSISTNRIIATTVEQTANNFFNALSGNDDSTAARLMSTQLKNKIKAKDLENLSSWMDYYGIDSGKCISASDEKTAQQNSYVLECTTNQNSKNVKFTFFLVSENNEPVVDRINIEAINS